MLARRGVQPCLRMIRTGLRIGLPIGHPKLTPTNERTNERTEILVTDVYLVTAVDARASTKIRRLSRPANGLTTASRVS